MNIGEIAERLIEAAEIIHNSVEHVGPAHARSLPLPYEHSQADKNGWGSERLAEERKEFWESLSRRPSARQVSEAEEAQGWYALVSVEQNREALAGWVHCMAGRGHFYDWCKKRGFHVETGRRRKDRALLEIQVRLDGRMGQHSETDLQRVLPNTPEIDDIGATIATDVKSKDGILGWTAEDAILTVFGGPTVDFSWAERRNERRRQREAAKRKRAAA